MSVKAARGEPRHLADDFAIGVLVDYSDLINAHLAIDRVIGVDVVYVLTRIYNRRVIYAHRLRGVVIHTSCTKYFTEYLMQFKPADHCIHPRSSAQFLGTADLHS